MVNRALYDTRVCGRMVCERLEKAHERWQVVRDREKGLEFLREAWMVSQKDLATIQEAHEGAAQFFVRIKDGIKAQIESGDFPVCRSQ